MAPIKHGGSGTPLYNVWKSMRQRCNNSKSQFYDRKHKGWSLDQIATTPKIPVGGYRLKGVRVYHG